MEYRVLGPLEVLDGNELLSLVCSHEHSLLARLLLHEDRVLARDRVIGDERRRR
jgi:DNA-binding SARP family transcriptional activator